MGRREIHCVIDARGNVSFEIRGVKGSGCQVLVDALKRLGRPLAEQRTAAYYQRVSGQSSLTVGAVKK